ncbi:hypothetical protein PFWH6_2830 [Pseudomonas fluorescens WH6]|nr:hypothetical protein PFWH6_2830 [Pseudomonas fluorescens WH6]
MYLERLKEEGGELRQLQMYSFASHHLKARAQGSLRTSLSCASMTSRAVSGSTIRAVTR